MLAHLHLHKTGGQTLRGILRRNFGTKHCDLILHETEKDMRWAARCYHNAVSIGSHAVKPGGLFDQFFPEVRFFTVLREPSARMISHYLYFEKRNWDLPSFEKFVELNRDFMCHAICGLRNADAAIEMIEQKIEFVGLQNHYDETLVMWKKWTGISKLDIRYASINVVGNNQGKKKLLADSNTSEMLKELNQEDYKLYQYAVEKIYPRQQKEYGATLAADTANFQKELTEQPLSKFSINLTLAKLKRNLFYKPFIEKPELVKKCA